MSLKQNLKNKINSYKTLDDIYEIARENNYYKTGTIDRRLRELTNEGLICPVMKNGAIIAYNPNKEIKTQEKPIFSLSELSERELNDKIREVMQNIRFSFGDERLAEFGNALKSPYKDTKIRIIKKYK